MGAHDFKLKKVPFPTLKISEYQCFAVCCPETSSCASKPLLLRYKLKNVPFFARKPVNLNVSRSAAPKLALVPASCYMCDAKQPNLKVCAKFH